MGEQILVALKGRDRMQEIIPNLQRIAKPGVRTVRDYILSSDFQLILMSAGSGREMIGLVRLLMLLLRRIKRSKFSSFLLCHPRHGARRERSNSLVAETPEASEGSQRNSMNLVTPQEDRRAM